MAAVCVPILAFEKSLIFTSLGLCEQSVEKRENNNWNILCKSELSNCKNSNFSGMKTPAQRSMYEEPNRVAEKWSKLGFIGFAIITPIMFVFPKAIFVYFIYYTTDAGRDAFDLPFLMWLVVHWINLSIGNVHTNIRFLQFIKIRRFPWDWRTPTGYFVAAILQYIQTIYVFTFSSMSLAMALGTVSIAITLVKDICHTINSVNDIANSDGNRIQMIEQLSDSIETHSRLLELSDVYLVVVLRFSFNLNSILTYFKNVFQAIWCSFQFNQRPLYSILDLVSFRHMHFVAIISNANSWVFHYQICWNCESF